MHQHHSCLGYRAAGNAAFQWDGLAAQVTQWNDQLDQLPQQLEGNETFLKALQKTKTRTQKCTIPAHTGWGFPHVANPWKVFCVLCSRKVLQACQLPPEYLLCKKLQSWSLHCTTVFIRSEFVMLLPHFIKSPQEDYLLPLTTWPRLRPWLLTLQALPSNWGPHQKPERLLTWQRGAQACDRRG